jgi:hypothetical protein
VETKSWGTESVAEELEMLRCNLHPLLLARTEDRSLRGRTNT